MWFVPKRVGVLAILGIGLIGWGAFFKTLGVGARQARRDLSSSYLTTRWTTENGLPQNSVSAIVQTPDGYLWLGTFGGLARFDGMKFTIFNSGNTPALRSNRITVLHVGRDGVLWIGAETGEITRFHDGAFNFFARIPADATGNKTIRTIYQDRAGSLWVGAEKQGLTRFVGGNPARAEFYDERHGLPPDTVNSVCEDRDGSLWVCATGGLASFQETPEGRGQFTIYLRRDVNDKTNLSDHLIRIRLHPEGGFWLLTQNTLGRFFKGNFTPYLNYSHNRDSVAGLSDQANGDLLFSYSQDRIFRIGQAGESAVTESKLDETKSFTVFSLLEDLEGNLWMGTIGDGLIRLRPRRVRMLNSASGLPDTGGGPVLEDFRGDLWIGTMDGICRLSGGNLTTLLSQAARKQKEGSKIGALYQDRAGNLWIGRDNGLTRHRNGRFTEYPLWGTGFVSAILEDRQGQMWLGTWDGLAQFHDGQVKMYRQSDGLVNNDVKFMLEDRAGALWLGTPLGLSRFQNGAFTNFTTDQGLSNNYVRAIHEDQDGTLWLGTYGGGLNRMRDGRITHITTKHGLLDDFISRILVDDDDHFWLLGNRGVFQVSRRALNEIADGQRQAVTGIVYDATDGMNPSEAQGGFQPAGWRGSDGRFWFPTIRGVAVVDPNLTSRLAPPAIIERVLLDGAELNLRQPIEIPPGKGNLEIHYTGLSLGKPEHVQFSFKLSGLDDESWGNVGGRRTAYFPQLQPGQYTFSVKAFSPDGVWSEREANLHFIVRPPFWRTAWFLALLVMGLAGLMLTGYRWRVALYRARIAQQEAFARQLIETQDHERARIAAELHDGLSQSLVIIKNRALSSLKAPDDHERALEQLREIAEASTHTIDEVREIIYDLHPVQLDRLGLTEAIGEMLGEIAETHGLEISSEFDDINRLLSKDSANNLYRIVQESLNNIIKHAKAEKVAVLLKVHTGSLALTVKDDGQGFVPAETQNHARRGGFGLTGIVERARLLGGESLIESAPGRGTTVSVTLPLKERHGAG